MLPRLLPERRRAFRILFYPPADSPVRMSRAQFGCTPPRAARMDATAEAVGLQSLPSEMIVLVLRNLSSVRDASIAAKTCHEWRAVFNGVLAVLLQTHCGKTTIDELDEDDWSVLYRAVQRAQERRSETLTSLTAEASASLTDVSAAALEVNALELMVKADQCDEARTKAAAPPAPTCAGRQLRAALERRE